MEYIVLIHSKIDNTDTRAVKVEASSIKEAKTLATDNHILFAPGIFTTGRAFPIDLFKRIDPKWHKFLVKRKAINASVV